MAMPFMFTLSIIITSQSSLSVKICESVKNGFGMEMFGEIEDFFLKSTSLQFGKACLICIGKPL
jgi:hypothetical protein